MRSAAVGVLAAIALAGCGLGPADTGGEAVTVAILRAVSVTAPGQAERHLREELRAAGYVEGGNLRIVPVDGAEAYPDPEAAEAAAAAWREEGVDVIVALSSSGAAAARRAAPDVPVLFISNDPTATGLVENEQQPEGLLTGVTFRVPADRTLTLARRLLPDLGRVGLVYPDGDPAAVAHRDAVAGAAESMGITLVMEHFTDSSDVGAAVDRLADQDVDLLLLSNSPAAVLALEATGAAAARRQTPVMANTHLADFALIALYPDNSEVQRQLGRQAARLLAGSRPSAIPVEDPRRFLTRINAVVAADYGIDLSEEALREANEVLTE